MRRIAQVIAKLVVAYVFAGAIVVMYARRSNFSGHADVPFSGFPEFLIWSPLAPALIHSDFTENRLDGLTGLLVFGTALALAAWFLFRQKKR
jgi:hypothetical protein